MNIIKNIGLKRKGWQLKCTGLLVGILCFGFMQAQNSSSLHQLIQENSELIFDELVAVRRDIHQHPELAGKEELTAERIASYLDSIGLEVKTGIGGHGVLGILRIDDEGRKIAWRADIDALPSNSPDLVPFPSLVEGVRHHCGHDVHTTIALGMATSIARYRQHLSGTVYFIFQPAEENDIGAQAMIDADLFERIHPDEIYACHVNPMPAGLISARSNEMYAYVKILTLQLKKQKLKDSEYGGLYAKLNAFSTVKSGSDFWNFQNFGKPNVGLASPSSIYRNYLLVDNIRKIETDNDTLKIEAVFTGTNELEMRSIPEKLKNSIIKEGLADEVEVAFTYEHPTVFNNQELTNSSLLSIAEIYGSDKIAPLYGIIPNFNDDFARMQKQVPGVYFLLGASNFDGTTMAMPHSPNFKVDEASIRYGVNYFTSLIVERLILK